MISKNSENLLIDGILCSILVLHQDDNGGVKPMTLCINAKKKEKTDKRKVKPKRI